MSYSASLSDRLVELKTALYGIAHDLALPKAAREAAEKAIKADDEARRVMLAESDRRCDEAMGANS